MTATEAASKTYRAPSNPIGRAGEPIRVFSFASGGFNTAMHLGVTHAFMIARARPPDVVAGVSAGAIHATVMAEVLKAGEHLTDEHTRAVKQVEVFTSFLEEELDAAAKLLALLLPDAYQVESRAPLEPLALPTQSIKERQNREKGVSARLELIRLINDCVGVRVSIGELTLLLRAWLGYRAAGEAPTRSTRAWQECATLWQVCGVCLTTIRPFAYFTRHLIGSALGPRISAMIRRIAVLRDLLPDKRNGKSAGAIMYEGLLWRRMGRWISSSVTWIVAVLFNAIVWFCLVGWCFGKSASALWWSVKERIGARIPLDPSSEPKPDGPLPNAPPGRITRWIQKALLTVLRDRNLNGSLLEPEVLRTLLIRVFDPTYYGVIDANELDRAIERSIREPRGAASRDLKVKRISHYQSGRVPIHLGVAASNLRSGTLELMPDETPVVDALMAATAIVPWFEVKEIKTGVTKELYVDALSVTREPTKVVMDLLRDRAHPEATEVVVYPVSHLTSADLKETRPDPLPTWVEVAWRANDLQEFRDARLEWNLTRLVSETLPPGGVRYEIENDGNQKRYLRTAIRPIEPDHCLTIQDKILEAKSEKDRHDVILTAIAEGCRATMERLFSRSIVSCGEGRTADAPREAPCSRVMSTRLPGRKPLPMTVKEHGPGLSRICSRCSYGTAPEVRRGHLRERDYGDKGGSDLIAEDWPLADWACKGAVSSSVNSTATGGCLKGALPIEMARTGERHTRPPELATWPHERRVGSTTLTGKDKPLISLLFSGGVFRGVYLVGVVNALHELGVRPDIIAGASVGSMTAVLAADLFARQDSIERAQQMARFASVFLRLDRLILTDEFAAFIRTFTLRAAQTRFSLWDMDHVLRRYDEGGTNAMSADMRRVLAGLERLFYVTPFDFYEIVSAFRSGRNGDAKKGLLDQLHRWLRRDNADDEILGSLPLARIIEAYVLSRLQKPGEDASDVPFQSFLADGIYLLATATNLTSGELAVLGDVISRRSAGKPASLLEGVLASSAFPGIFRPRRSWEVFRGEGNEDQFADGGVMDNLPLDAVAKFIHSVAEESIVARRPIVNGVEVPHLLFTASLEADPDSDIDVSGLAKDWRQAVKRTKQLAFNRKIDSYRSAQHHLRALYHSRQQAGSGGAQFGFIPADLEIVDVRPQWLCSTFAFHPMMGFRRQRQAESIAHGCASTIVKLQRMVSDQGTRPWAKAWGILETGTGVQGLQPRTDISLESGNCVFRDDALCPFSPKALGKLGERVLPETKGQLEQIYYACRRGGTHERPPA